MTKSEILKSFVIAASAVTIFSTLTGCGGIYTVRREPIDHSQDPRRLGPYTPAPQTVAPSQEQANMPTRMNIAQGHLSFVLPLRPGEPYDSHNKRYDWKATYVNYTDDKGRAYQPLPDKSDSGFLAKLGSFAGKAHGAAWQKFGTPPRFNNKSLTASRDEMTEFFKPVEMTVKHSKTGAEVWIYMGQFYEKPVVVNGIFTNATKAFNPNDPALDGATPVQPRVRGIVRGSDGNVIRPDGDTLAEGKIMSNLGYLALVGAQLLDGRYRIQGAIHPASPCDQFRTSINERTFTLISDPKPQSDAKRNGKKQSDLKKQKNLRSDTAMRNYARNAGFPVFGRT